MFSRHVWSISVLILCLAGFSGSFVLGQCKSGCKAIEYVIFQDGTCFRYIEKTCRYRDTNNKDYDDIWADTVSNTCSVFNPAEVVAEYHKCECEAPCANPPYPEEATSTGKGCVYRDKMNKRTCQDKGST